MTFNINFCNLTEMLEKEDFIMKLKLLLTKPIVIFFLRTLFYLLIFFGLFWFYGFKNPNGAQFIYNEF